MQSNSTLIQELLAFETRNLVIILTVFVSISTIIIIFVLYNVVQQHIFEQQQKEPHELWQEYLIENTKDKNSINEKHDAKEKKKKKKFSFNLSVLTKKKTKKEENDSNENENRDIGLEDYASGAAMNQNAFENFMQDDDDYVPQRNQDNGDGDLNTNDANPPDITGGNYIEASDNEGFEKSLRKKELKSANAKFFKRAGILMSDQSATTD